MRNWPVAATMFAGGACRIGGGLAFALSLIFAIGAQAANPWYDASWANRIAITINHARVSGSLTNFPVLIGITNSSLQQYAQANGNDILFTSGDGTNKLSHEIESYTSASGALWAWVNVPNLSSTTDTNIYLYFRNPSAGNQQNAAGVWDSNYKGVWHLNQTPTGSAGDMADSTSGNNDGTSQTISSGVQVAGKISGSLTLDGTSDYISTANSFTDPTTIVIEAWVKTTSTAGRKVVGFENAQTGTGSASFDRHIYISTGGLAQFGTWNAVSGVANIAISTNVVNDGQWHFVVGYRDNSANVVGIYVDGALRATATSTSIQSYTGWYRIGAYKIDANWTGSGGDGYLAGSVDEIRVSHAIRSASWIATEYNNQSSPATFSAVADQETTPATQLAITAINGGSNPTAGTVFSVVVQAQNVNGSACNVTSNTAVTISLNTGSGTLGGSLSGTILAGTNSVTISGVTYTKAQSGVVLTATGTSGDNLTAGVGSAFTVNPGSVSAAQSTVTANPSSVTANGVDSSTITVTLKDAYSNPVSGKTVTLGKSGGGSVISAASPDISQLG